MNCPYCDNPIPSGVSTCPACGAPIPANQKNKYGSEILEHIKKVVTMQYFCFEGRMSRRDYWTYFLPAFVLCLIPYIGWILFLALLLPTLGATARRLHDVGKTGWLNILWFICPPIGPIIVLLMCIKEGDADSNKYGDAPAAPAAE